MSLSLQQALLLVLGALVPATVYLVNRADIVVVVALVNVLLIWASLRIATGGTLRPGSDVSDAAEPDEA